MPLPDFGRYPPRGFGNDFKTARYSVHGTHIGAERIAIEAHHEVICQVDVVLDIA
jgi:hypothetical protein